MNVFEEVKNTVTARDAAEFYGIKANSNGMAICPFHHDRNPSLKLDKRFHCFGCGEDGDVIDFTVKLYGLKLRDAAEKLCRDFHIPYSPKGNSGGSRAAPSLPRRSPEQEYKEAERRVFRVYCDYFHLLRQWKADYAPKTEDEEWDDRFVEAGQKIDYVEYLLDTLLTGSIEERAAIVREHAKDVRKLERRIQHLTTRDTGSCAPGNQRNGAACCA